MKLATLLVLAERCLADEDLLAELAENLELSDKEMNALQSEVEAAVQFCTINLEVPVIASDEALGSKEHNITVSFKIDGISVCPQWYSDSCSKDGEGSPILIERQAGRMQVVVWDDINAEDASHNISLEGARESERDE